MSSNKVFERELKDAIESSTPNILPKLLRSIELNEGGKDMETSQTISNVFHSTKGTKSSPWIRWSISAAAVFVIFIATYFTNVYYTPQSVIAFDVNPSIELKVNKFEKVLDVIPKNEEAKEVIGDMKLSKLDLDIAVNALIGAMVKNGYLNDIKNSILITVDSKDKEKGAQLQNRITADINTILKDYKLQGAVLSQSVKDDSRIKELADKYNISFGKAALIDLLIKQKSYLKFKDMAKLSINDINLLIAAKHDNMQDINITGNASNKGYIGEEKALSIALKYLGIDKSMIKALEVDMDYEHGKMVYDVEFHTSDAEHDFEIDAVTGEILDYEKENNHKNVQVVNDKKDDDDKYGDKKHDDDKYDDKDDIDDKYEYDDEFDDDDKDDDDKDNDTDGDDDKYDDKDDIDDKYDDDDEFDDDDKDDDDAKSDNDDKYDDDDKDDDKDDNDD